MFDLNYSGPLEWVWNYSGPLEWVWNYSGPLVQVSLAMDNFAHPCSSCSVHAAEAIIVYLLSAVRSSHGTWEGADHPSRPPGPLTFHTVAYTAKGGPFSNWRLHEETAEHPLMSNILYISRDELLVFLCQTLGLLFLRIGYRAVLWCWAVLVGGIVIGQAHVLFTSSLICKWS